MMSTGCDCCRDARTRPPAADSITTSESQSATAEGFSEEKTRYTPAQAGAAFCASRCELSANASCSSTAV
eukprot:1378979-Rhodomonas_salina.1